MSKSRYLKYFPNCRDSQRVQGAVDWGKAIGKRCCKADRVFSWRQIVSTQSSVVGWSCNSVAEIGEKDVEWGLEITS